MTPYLCLPSSPSPLCLSFTPCLLPAVSRSTHADSILQSKDASFPAAFPGACELLEPLAPPAQCLCANSFRKEVACSRVCHKGYELSQCCCGCVSALANAFQVTIPRLPPDLVVSNCTFSQAWLHTMHFWCHPGNLTGPSPFYV